VNWFEMATDQKMTPDLITPIDLRQYKSYMNDILSLKPQTINRRLSSLRSFLNWARISHLLPDDLPPAVPKPIPEAKKGPQWLDKNQQHALIRMLQRGRNQRDLAIVILLLNTGLRVSELCNLMWSDILITDRKGSLVVRSGKGGKRREIPLNKDARNALNSVGYAENKGLKEIIFQGQRGKMTPRGIESMLKKYVGHTKLSEVTPHKLRHTFCKNLIDVGVSLEKVAMLAGHNNLQTTIRYCTPSQLDLEKAVALIELDD
jgi:integrase/recombinase XerC